MAWLERFVDRLPRPLVQVAAGASVVFALLGSGCTLLAVALGSIAWVAVGATAFGLAALSWHVGAVAADVRGARAVSSD